jgi:hypothetical protein
MQRLILVPQLVTHPSPFWLSASADQQPPGSEKAIAAAQANSPEAAVSWTSADAYIRQRKKAA